MKKVKLAHVCPWQNHSIKFSDLANSYPESEVVAVWDDDIECGTAFAQQVGCRFEGDYEKLLNDKEIDGFIITAPIPRYMELLMPAINAGKHIFIEKPMAVRNEDADAICEAAERNGIHMTVSDPILKPGILYAKKLADEGVLGDIKMMRIHIVFGDAVPLIGKPELKDFVENRGGAMCDSHASHILNWFLGEPQSVTAVMCPLTDFGADGELDVQSAAIYKFKNGALGIAEAGYVMPGQSYNIEIYGTKGCARVGRESAEYNVGGKDDTWVKVPKENLPEGAAYPLKYFVESIANDTKNELYTPQEAREVTRMISAVHRSAGREESI